MKAFMITEQNRVTLCDPKEATAESTQIFGTEAELAAITAEFPAGRLVAVWNSLPGEKPVKKFTDRKTAVARIWKAVQALEPAPAPQQPTTASKKVQSAKRASTPKEPTLARSGSKKAKVLSLLRRENGATIHEIMRATDWQPHTVRGFISGSLTKKMGLKIESAKRPNGDRAYTVSE